MVVQAGGIWLTVLVPEYSAWLLGAVLQGLGTAMVYPTLLAAIGDVAHPSWTLTPVVAQSDIYGRWSTAETTQFWDGTYTAYMEQFKPGNWALDRPVG